MRSNGGPGMRPGNNKKTPNSWFDKQIQKFGDNFLGIINARDMQQSAQQLFRDFSKQRINFEKHGQYFYDPQFLESLIFAANAICRTHHIHWLTNDAYMRNMPIAEADLPLFHEILINDNRSVSAWSSIIDGLMRFKQTGDIGHLCVLANNLRNFRANI